MKKYIDKNKEVKKYKTGDIKPDLINLEKNAG